MTVLTDVRAVCFPYCLDRQADGRWVPLNRRYKPLGFMTTEFVEYKQYPVALGIDGITPGIAKKLSVHADPDPDRIYLYNDATSPLLSADNMAAYMKKLEVLAVLPVVGA